MAGYLSEIDPWLVEMAGYLSELGRWLAEMAGYLSEIDPWLVEMAGYLSELGRWLAEMAGYLSELGRWLEKMAAHLSEMRRWLVEMPGWLSETERWLGEIGACSEVKRHPCREEGAGRRIRRMSESVDELGLALRARIDARPKKAAKVGVQGKRAAEAELEARACLTPKIAVLRVECAAPATSRWITAHVGRREAKPGHDVGLCAGARIDEKKAVQRKGLLIARVA
jgi:hypothetical protein